MSAENWLLVLNHLQDFRSQLETWGITREFLIGIAVFSALLFLISLREVAGWFLRVPHMRGEIKSLKQQISDLQSTLEEMNKKATPSENRVETVVVENSSDEKDDEEDDEPAGKSGRHQFRLDH